VGGVRQVQSQLGRFVAVLAPSAVSLPQHAHRNRDEAEDQQRHEDQIVHADVGRRLLGHELEREQERAPDHAEDGQQRSAERDPVSMVSRPARAF
jgi:hypothetical protein